MKVFIYCLPIVYTVDTTTSAVKVRSDPVREKLGYMESIIAQIRELEQRRTFDPKRRINTQFYNIKEIEFNRK